MSEVSIISSVNASTRAQSVSEGLFILGAFMSKGLFAFIFVPFKAHGCSLSKSKVIGKKLLTLPRSKISDSNDSNSEQSFNDPP
jgi:hypothetical protein